VDFPIEHGDFPSFFVGLPEGIGKNKHLGSVFAKALWQIARETCTCWTTFGLV